MSRRCPNATPVGSVILSGYKLEFRRVATIKHTKKTDDKLGCGLCEITEKCEKSSKKTFKNHLRIYQKVKIKVT